MLHAIFFILGAFAVMLICSLIGAVLGAVSFRLTHWYRARNPVQWTVYQYEPGRWVGRGTSRESFIGVDGTTWSNPTYVSEYCVFDSEHEVWGAIAKYENQQRYHQERYRKMGKAC